jgi:tRNA-splicing ligase RtcB
MQQLAQESKRIFIGGSMDGNWKLAFEELVSDTELVRDGGLATIGGSNHL